MRAKWSEATGFISKYDIITLTETKLDKAASPGSLAVPGFLMNRQDRTSHGGGIVTYIREDLRPEQMIELQAKFVSESLEVTITRIQVCKPDRALVVIGVYRPPSAKAAWFEAFNELVMTASALGQMIIMGDINANLLKSNEYPGNALQKSLLLARTTIPDIKPTRVNESCATCLDIIAMSTDLICTSYNIGSLAASDHFPVEATVALGRHSILRPILKRALNKVDVTDLMEKASKIELDTRDNQSPDQLLDQWQTSLNVILDDVAPLKPHPMRKNRVPWMTQEVKDLIAQRDGIARKLKETPVAERKPIKEELQQARRKAKSIIRASAKSYGLETLCEENRKGSWRFIRQMTFSAPKGDRNRMDINTLNEFFATTVQATDLQSDAQPPPGCDNSNSFQLRELEGQEVLNLLNSIKSDTATGCDDIPGFLLKKIAAAVAPNIATIFNRSILAGEFPTTWKKANVSAVWKGKGSRSEPSNYRPVSVLPVLGRLLEKAIATQLGQYCEDNSIVPVQQFGFRRRSSCETALLTATDAWMRSVDEGKLVGALLVDLSKAFDTVPHQKLINELSRAGCGLQALNWFTNYLTSREQRVAQRPDYAPWKRVTRGVPQGSCLSPLLFNVFVRDIPEKSNVDTTQFADDITHSEADHLPSSLVDKLTEAYNRTKEFCNSHELIINAAKTQFIVFKSAAKPLPPSYAINLDGFIIEPTQTVQLLGVTLDRHLTFGPFVDDTSKKCHGLLGALSRAAPFLPTELLRLAYIALVRSRLEYCSTLLVPIARTHLDKLDVIQRIAARIACHLPRRAHAAPILKQLRLESLESRREARVLKVIDSILRQDCHPAIASMFQRDTDGRLINDATARIKVGHKRFSMFGKEVYNKKFFPE